MFEPDYTDDRLVRRVRRSGEIKWRGKGIYISESLIGEAVGLGAREDGGFVLCFGSVLLGTITPDGKFRRPKLKTQRRKPVQG